jgi:hypothetical protein
MLLPLLLLLLPLLLSASAGLPACLALPPPVADDPCRALSLFWSDAECSLWSQASPRQAVPTAAGTLWLAWLPATIPACCPALPPTPLTPFVELLLGCALCGASGEL